MPVGTGRGRCDGFTSRSRVGQVSCGRSAFLVWPIGWSWRQRRSCSNRSSRPTSAIQLRVSARTVGSPCSGGGQGRYPARRLHRPVRQEPGDRPSRRFTTSGQALTWGPARSRSSRSSASGPSGTSNGSSIQSEKQPTETCVHTNEQQPKPDCRTASHWSCEATGWLISDREHRASVLLQQCEIDSGCATPGQRDRSWRRHAVGDGP